MMKRLKHLQCGDRLSKLGEFSTANKSLREELINV